MRAAVAGALERYRLTHDSYPETLDTLAPQFIAKLPHDIINGQPLKYRRMQDGLFVLYSVGWNETDDGGTVALVAASGTGKTTAGRVLGRRLGYVSDETIAVEHDLTVRAYPKPLSIVVNPATPRVKHERSPDDLGLLRAAGALRRRWLGRGA